ncbi:substrate-binding periplasmic protein, partial [Vibrio genomosp. F10]
LNIMRDRFNIVFLLLVSVLASFSALAKYDMHFFLPDFPPYTTVDNQGIPTGLGVDKVTTILDSLDVNYNIEVGSNHGRALTELRLGRSDGFFMASKNSERDRYAVFSETVMVNRWVWVVLKKNMDQFDPRKDVFKKEARVMSLLNTNTNYWLLNNEYNTLPHAVDIQGLVEALDSGQTDAVFVAEVVFQHYVENSDKYHIILEKEKEFGVYISNNFLEKYPRFMFELNIAIRALR